MRRSRFLLRSTGNLAVWVADPICPRGICCRCSRRAATASKIRKSFPINGLRKRRWRFADAGVVVCRHHSWRCRHTVAPSPPRPTRRWPIHPAKPCKKVRAHVDLKAKVRRGELRSTLSLPRSFADRLLGAKQACRQPLPNKNLKTFSVRGNYPPCHRAPFPSYSSAKTRKPDRLSSRVRSKRIPD